MFKHLEENKMSYLEHLVFAAHISIIVIIAGMCCLIHALFPFIFTKTLSSTLLKIQNKIERKKND